MSIPAAYRHVLQDGDPAYPANAARMVILYGPHLKNCLHAYTIDAMAEIERDIKALPRGSDQRKWASRLILGKSMEAEVDRDGRIILPKERREQIGLEGEALMIAMGDYFEIWNKATYEAEDEAEMLDYLEKQDKNFDPLTLLDGAGG
ncbi:division/cell wall cluster transcriptional repressor MraZ [Aquicoccus sp. SCR17]|nr:division/cell wall cluster transcriptional repressor MraZ [Carideicomes alvinocaridis]